MPSVSAGHICFREKQCKYREWREANSNMLDKDMQKGFKDNEDLKTTRKKAQVENYGKKSTHIPM